MSWSPRWLRPELALARSRSWAIGRSLAILRPVPRSAPRLVPHSSRGLGHRPLKAEITGSNPVCGTNILGVTGIAREST
jgi:hypothetical protein